MKKFPIFSSIHHVLNLDLIVVNLNDIASKKPVIDTFTD